MITTSLNFSSLDPNTFRSMSEEKKGILLDIRTPAEYAEQHLHGSINFDFYSVEFEKQLENLDKNHPYFIYCRTGSRTKTVLDIMKSIGFKEVYDLKGGIIAWEINLNS
ncbi:rhodanese-like domain-containing protein [Candidatus Dojkabacteria bacterium]|jgi:rhodanese-related sulfurtransferase|uniref:Rhodanese-like domain-containing protein n=1 Tax=Candidatus Dojkabacteria bacterium TaxID=2099670 RepID=A0A955I793_9BACT|nr:rhodanese-like domain-containing protein [Candidatus Dojkabacteria bacterium]